MKGRSKQKKKFDKTDLEQALIKKALGYDATEVVEEYSTDEQGEVKLVKKKVTTKNVPPDITAIKILIEDNASKSVLELSDQELESEKQRLLKLLKEFDEKEK